MKRVSMLPPSNSGITACVLVFMFQNVRSPEELIFQLLQPDGFTIAAKNIEGHDLLNAAQTFLQGQSIPKSYGIMHGTIWKYSSSAAENSICTVSDR